MTYAAGKHALAICDRCGFSKKYSKLIKEWTGFKVCSECYEPKNPQLNPPRNVADPEALKSPRPPTNLEEQRDIQYSFDPVGFSGDEALTINPLRGNGEVGQVEVTTT
jgi:hypothetical protein